MARKTSQGDPAISIDFFTSGFYTYRSELFAPFKGIGVNVVSFHDPVIAGLNFELTDKFQWTRRAGFSIFCPTPLADGEVVNDYYSSRNLNGQVVAFADTNQRLVSFSQTGLSAIVAKTTAAQGYISTVGNITYFADGAAADYYYWNTSRLAAWGLAPPTVIPTISGMGFWLPITSFALGNSILDPNGNVEFVSAILIPNGSFLSPTLADQLPLAGDLGINWVFEPVNGGYAATEGYGHVQQIAGNTSTAIMLMTFGAVITVGNVVIVNLAVGSQNFIPTVTSVTDNLGNAYTLQASAIEQYNGGGGNVYYEQEFVYTAPVTTGGVCTVRAQTTQSGGFGGGMHEFAGIGATKTTSAQGTNNFTASLNSGTVNFTGTQLVYTAVTSESGNPRILNFTPPAGYILGVSSIGGNAKDAYAGVSTTASPTWSMSGAGLNPDVGITVVFPISSLATGHTKYLFLHDFHANVPAGATIVGVAVAIPKFDSAFGTVQDQSVKLVIGGAVVGTEHAQAVNWSNAGYFVANYGSAVDTWGAAPTAAQINTNGLSGFGVAIAANITSIAGGSVRPEIGFLAPNQVTVTIYFQNNGTSGPGISGATEPIWATTLTGSVNDGGITWTNYGPILNWFPITGYTPPAVVLDTNGNLQLATHVANPIPAWSNAIGYTLGQIVYFGGQYWVSVFNGTNTGVVPTVNYTVDTTAGATATTVPYWALTTTPLVTGLIPPVWNTTVGGTTVDGSYTWTNIGQGTGLAFMGYAYVYGYRTVDGHLTTSSPFSSNTGAILGPLNATITSFSITSNVVTFTGSNNFLPGNIFEARNLIAGAFMDSVSFTVISATPSESFPLTSVAVNGANVLTILAINNLVAGQQVTFSGVITATFLNGVTVTVLGGGLSGTQFTANFTHAAYGPTVDTGTVTRIGSYTANFTHADVSLTLDSGVALPLIAKVSGIGTVSPLCNSVATITAVSATASIVKITASNNFQPGIFVTVSDLTSATFLNGQQVQVIAVDQPVGTQNTWFKVFFSTPDYGNTGDAGTATFNAIEIYRTSDGGGTYLFSGAVTNPGTTVWGYNDFVVDAALDIELVAPLFHQNDPPPGASGSSIQSVGSILVYWQGRLWMVVGNFVYFDAGPDCTNGIPEQAWPPGNRFQFAGPVFGLEKTPDGVGLLVYLADRVDVILGGPETISFYATDALSNFGIANPNAVFRDGSTIGQLTTQQQYIELISGQKDDVGERIGDYLAANFNSAKSYVTMHRNGLDVGVFISNGVDRIVRYGSNIHAWSVPAFPAFGAGAIASIETSVGVYTLMAASPTGGRTSALGPINPTSGTNVAIGAGPMWVNPSNITLGSTSSYAVTTFAGPPATSQVLRATAYPSAVPSTAVIRGVTVTVVGKQSEISGDLTLKITPTIPGGETQTFSFGTSNTTVILGGVSDLWGMPWSPPYLVNGGAISFDITATDTSATFGGSPASYVQSVSLTGAGSTSVPLPPFSGNNTAGNTIIVFVQANNGLLSTVTVTDTQGNMYTQVGGYLDYAPDLRRSSVWTATSIKAGANTITVGIGAAPGAFNIFAAEYAGAIAAFSNQVATSGNSFVTLTTANANDIVVLFQYAATSSTAVPPAGFNLRQSTNPIFDSSIYWDKTIVSPATTTYTVTGINHGGHPEAMLWGLVVSGGGNPAALVSVADVQVIITYQNPGNYLYARDINSWGDGGNYGQNNGSPYPSANIVLGSVTLSQPGAPMMPLQHIVGYFDGVGILTNGGPSMPNIWILPNEVFPTTAVNFIQLPEATQEPPVGQNKPSTSLLALRWPVSMMNSDTASQFIHHLQVKIEFEPENAPNTIKAIAFKENQD